jgi:hypothetical protein
MLFINMVCLTVAFAKSKPSSGDVLVEPRMSLLHFFIKFDLSFHFVSDALFQGCTGHGGSSKSSLVPAILYHLTLCGLHAAQIFCFSN